MARNVVLLCLDTLRQDYFAEYAPRIADRASVVYPQARAASCWSIPSHASMFTGQLPSRHGVHAHNLDFTSITTDTFLSDLDGYRRFCISTNDYASADFGFDRLFDEFEHIDSGPFEIAGIPVEEWLFTNTPIPHIRDNGTKAALKSLKSAIEASDEPFFAFVNLMETHAPHHDVLGYDSEFHTTPNRWSWRDVSRSEVARNVADNQEYLQHYRSIYRASVDYVDRQVATFFDWLRNTVDAPTTVVLTADHGENLGFDTDGGLFGHTTSLSEGVLHVPLAIVNPPDVDIEFEDRYISLLRLPDLVTGLLDERLPDVSQKSIAAEVVGHAITFKSNPTYWDRMLRGVYDGDRKYVWDSFERSFEYELDSNRPSWQRLRAEDVTVPTAYLSLFDENIREFKHAASIAQFEGGDTIDEDTETRLEDLGYL